MSFGDSIKSFFSRYAQFSGRASRSEYWYAVLFMFLASTVMGILDKVSGLNVLQAIFGFIVLLPSVAVQVRRLHDINRSGWWIVGLFAPGGALFGLGVGVAASSANPLSVNGLASTLMVLGGVASIASYVLLLVWLCSKGTSGQNDHGADPFDATGKGFGPQYGNV